MKRITLIAGMLLTLAACSPGLECSPPAAIPSNLSGGSPALQQGDYSMATDELLVAAKTDSNAQYMLGLFHEEGLGTPQDYAAAACWYRAAAIQDHPKAQFHLADIIWSGIKGSSTSHERHEARKLFSQASRQLYSEAERGDAEAQYMIGYMLGWGKGLPINEAESKRWFRKAGEQGHAKAQFELAQLYEGGLGYKYGEKDFPEALKWFHLAAESGYPAAQYRLGDLYRWGALGLTSDHTQALTWYSLAAVQGHEGASVARDDLGRSMTPQELAEARQRVIKWCQSARTDC